ncbi:NAD-dependent epimerase/dehydratase family protein [bacterium]|nr:NAD-dependent epimerase/dehydratase family protein [bacterium]
MNKQIYTQYRGQRILITGGLGFLGSTLAIRLVELGASVTIIDGMIDDLGANFFNIEPVKDRVEVRIANLSDRSATDHYCRDKDLIFNFGMQSSHLDSMKKPLYDLELNIIPQLTFLESLRTVNPQARIVYIGSRAQFGPVKELPINETSLLSPADIYAVGKQAVEWYHLLYSSICGLRPICLRLGNTYGPRHQMRHAKYGVQNYLLRLALEGKTIQVFGDGLQLREMIYIDDVIEALIVLAMTDRAFGQVFCIGTREKVRFVDLVKAIIHACESGSYKHVPWPEDRQAIEVGDVDTDFSKLTEFTGWQPTTSLETGLKLTADYYRRYGHHYW